MMKHKIKDLGFKNWILVSILTSFFLLLTSSLFAANPTELEQEIEKVRRDREALVEEQKRLERELETINREGQTLGAAVKSLDATRRKLAADISVTQSKISSTNLTIRSLENTMTEKERQIITHRKAISDALYAISEADSRPLILNVLAAVELSEIWKDRGDIEDINSHLEQEIDRLRDTKAKLSQEKAEKERAHKEQLSLAGELKGQKSVVEENQKAKSTLLAQTKNKEAEYQKLLSDNLAAQKQFEEDLYRLESQLRLTIDPSLIPPARHGTLSWPVDNVFVTQQFGDTAFARSGAYSGRGHNGIDFRASMGTTIRSVSSGTVRGTGNTDEMNAQLRRQGQPICGSYGRWILIDHDNGLSSVYAHLSSSIVNKGDRVDTGQVIGYSGGTPGVNGSGYSTGPHLHLGLFASQGVEIRQFTTSKNCKHTTVPIADLRAYLDPLEYLPAL